MTVVGRLASEAEAALIDGGGLTVATLSRHVARPDVEACAARLVAAGYSVINACDRRGGWWTSTLFRDGELVDKVTAEQLMDAVEALATQYAPLPPVVLEEE